VVTPEGAAAAPPTRTRADPALIKALARAFRYQRLLDEGRYASISEMAAAEKIERGYLGTLLRLTLLAPDIVEAILDGRQALALGLAGLMDAFPAEWLEQRRALLNTAAAPELARPPLDAMSARSRMSRPSAVALACGRPEAPTGNWPPRPNDGPPNYSPRSSRPATEGALHAGRRRLAPD
jgi:hypothetical protein